MGWTVEKSYVARIGGNTFIDCEAPLVYKGHEIFRMKRREDDGVLGVDFEVNDPTGARLITVRNSKVVGTVPEGWGVEHHPDVHRVRDAGRNPVLEVWRRKNGAEVVVVGTLYMADGEPLVLTETEIRCRGITFTNNTISHSRVGMSFG